MSGSATRCLIERFPALIEYFKLEEHDNMERFRRFWDALRTSKHEEHKEDEHEVPGFGSSRQETGGRPPFFPPSVLFQHLGEGSESQTRRRPVGPDRPPVSDTNHPLPLWADLHLLGTTTSPPLSFIATDNHRKIVNSPSTVVRGLQRHACKGATQRQEARQTEHKLI